jgi:hypothetical protein
MCTHTHKHLKTGSESHKLACTRNNKWTAWHYTVGQHGTTQLDSTVSIPWGGGIAGEGRGGTTSAAILLYVEGKLLCRFVNRMKASVGVV